MSWSTANPIFVDVKLPITAKQLDAINRTTGRVQFSYALADRDHQKLAKRLLQFPKTALRTYELFGTPERSLDFLQNYQGLKQLQINLYGLESVEGIEHVADSLEHLEIGRTKHRLPLDFLSRFGHLKGLCLEEHATGIEVLSQLKQLEELSLRSITLDNLEVVADLPNLWSLELILGGTKNLAALSRAKSLKNLELRLVRNLADISVVSEIPALQRIVLDSLRNVPALPSLKKLHKLRRITLKKMKGIDDLTPLLHATALEDAIIICASHLASEALRPRQKHVSLKAIGFGLGSNKKNRAVALMFPQLQHTIKYPFIYQ